MIKILGISASPRKGATEYSLKESLNEVNKISGLSTELILLRNLELNYCIHCDLCIRKEVSFAWFIQKIIKKSMKSSLKQMVT